MNISKCQIAPKMPWVLHLSGMLEQLILLTDRDRTVFTRDLGSEVVDSKLMITVISWSFYRLLRSCVAESHLMQPVRSK